MNQNNDEGFPKALTNEEIIECFKLLKDGDCEAEKKIKRHNLRLIVYRISQRFTNTNIEMDELINIGAVGLMKAVKTFDIDKKVSFASYASVCIDNEILIYLNHQKKHANSLSTSKLIVNKQGEDVDLTFENFFANEEDFVEDIIISKESYMEIHEALRVLNPFELKIVQLYYGFNCNPMSQSKIGEITGFNQVYISSTLIKARKKLKKFLDEKAVKVLKLNVTKVPQKTLCKTRINK